MTKQALTLTDAAAERVKNLMSTSKKDSIGLRVGVRSGGCSGMAYTMEFAEAAEPFDEVVEDKGVKILIDPKAIMYLIGTEMDFVQSKMQSGFVFNNPNETGRCGCGESFTV